MPDHGAEPLTVIKWMDVARSPQPGEHVTLILNYQITRRKQFHFIIADDGASLFCSQNSGAAFDFLDTHEIYDIDIQTRSRLYSASFSRHPPQKDT